MIRASLLSVMVVLIGFISGSVVAEERSPTAAPVTIAREGFVAAIEMKMMILPGTASFLQESIRRAEEEGAKLLIITLDTPGGILQTTQEMTQAMFRSTVPIAVYVAPSGATATSAGVFITMAGNVAVMAPGTSIGAAHPVTSEGKDIGGDMRTKAENATVAMIKSIAAERKRSAEWAEKAVKESSSLTAQEAVTTGAVDFIAADRSELLKKLAGRAVPLPGGKTVVMEDLSALPVRVYEQSTRDQVINFLSHPNVAALLWLLATTGLSIELYNPGLIIPGVVGAIALVLSLVVSQVIPFNMGALALLVFGAFLIGLEMFMGSIVLGIGGVISIVLGALYLIDSEQAPGLAVSGTVIGPIALIAGLFLLAVSTTAVRTMRKRSKTGSDGLVGQHGKALGSFADRGEVLVEGEIWKAVTTGKLISKGDVVVVRKLREGLTLEVEVVEPESRER